MENDNNQIKSDIEDLENGDEVKINNYANPNSSAQYPQQGQTQAQAPSTETILVNPSAAAPEMPSKEALDSIQNATTTPQSTINPQTTTVSAQIKQKPLIKPVDPVLVEKRLKARKKAVLGCFGGFFLIITVLLILSFIFIAQAHKGMNNPLEALLGVSQAGFVNGLIVFINIIFLLLAIFLFIFTMSGFLKVLTAKRDDKEQKKRGIRMSIIFGIVLFIFLIVWVFIFAYLDGQRMATNEKPLVDIETTPEDTINLEAPISIKFDASGVKVSKDFRIISYRWDFGDDKVGSGMVVSHEYKDKGDTGRFDVILEVTKQNINTGDELVDTYSKIVTIAGEALSAKFVADPLKGEAPLKVNFDASASTSPDSDITAFEWDFNDDGEFDDSTGYITQNTFDKVGKYKVSLRVTNAIGNYAVLEQEIVVSEGQDPEAIISVIDDPEKFVLNRQYIFSAEDSSSPNGKIVEYIWDFGDKKEYTTKNVPFIFTNEGTYLVSLIVIDETDKENEVIKEIKIGTEAASPIADFQTNPAMDANRKIKGTVPFRISFDASSSTDPDDDIVDYQWDFLGNGTIDTYGKTTEYNFDKDGTYQCKLTVVDSEGNSSEKTVTIEISEQGIIASLKADKIEGSVPMTVEFDASGSTYSGGTITSYKWDFGDGSSPKLGSATIRHKYSSIGTYTASVEVVGADNSKAKKEIFITVREIPLKACFNSVFISGVAPLQTSFDPNCSSGTISNYYWDFGDGTTSNSVKPNHTFNKAGEYNVILEVSDSDNTVDQINQKITVTSVSTPTI